MINTRAIALKPTDMNMSGYQHVVKNKTKIPVSDFSWKFNYLRSHWLENTFDGFRVKNRHFGLIIEASSAVHTVPLT